MPQTAVANATKLMWLTAPQPHYRQSSLKCLMHFKQISEFTLRHFFLSPYRRNRVTKNCYGQVVHGSRNEGRLHSRLGQNHSGPWTMRPPAFPLHGLKRAQNCKKVTIRFNQLFYKEGGLFERFTAFVWTGFTQLNLVNENSYCALASPLAFFKSWLRFRHALSENADCLQKF